MRLKTTSKKPYLSIVLPTYNEAGNILPLIKELTNTVKKSRISTEILIIDDDSPDQTAKIAQNEENKNPLVRVYLRKSNHGLAASILHGIRHAKGNLVLVMDTDFNHDPKVIPKMIQMSDTCDLVVGSRFIKGGGMENKLRNGLSFLFNLYIRCILLSNVHDHLSGYFLIKKKKLQIFANDIVFHGFGDYFIRLIYNSQKANLKIQEVPIYYKNRVWGKSKSKFISMFITYTKTAFTLRVYGL